MWGHYQEWWHPAGSAVVLLATMEVAGQVQMPAVIDCGGALAG